MEIRAMKGVSLTFVWCLCLATLAQARLSTYPYEEFLDEMMNRIDSELPPGFVLPPNFRSELINGMSNETVTMDTSRPFSRSRTAAKFTPKTEEIGQESHYHLYLYEQMTQRFGIPRETALRLLSVQLSPFCQMNPVSCDASSPFRTIDGSCNNLQNVYWGASFRTFTRILPAAYEDQLAEPRGGMTNSYLPNPRLITTTIHYDVINPDPTITNMVPQFGQFVDHDLSLAPEADHHCCTSQVGAQDCWPIPIPSDDPFYSNLKEPQTCMPFTRSTPFCFPDSSGIREPFNILTSYLDASQVYGSDHERAGQLRAHRGGRLAVHSQNPNLLPTVSEIEARENANISFMGKYLAGDERVNEMPALTTMHILLVREHNRIAGAIEQIRPTWSDDRIYEEARRILIAQWQNIVYGEYLPVILGQDAVRRYGLQLDNGYSSYDRTINPTIFHGFATAAYRFGHTLINGIIQLYRGLANLGSYQLKDNFFESEQVDKNNGDGYNLILGGLIMQSAQTYDPHITTALSQFVLKDRSAEFGADLIARNVQRGREHGIPSYAEYRAICNLRPLTDWSNRPAEILEDTWSRMEFLYRAPQDIDLFTGGISEIPLPGAYSGATFNCLKGIQFHRLRYGDRFFFTHGNQAGSYTPAQLRHLRSRRLGDIICENSNVPATTVNVFRTQQPSSNPLVGCTAPSRTRLDFELLLQRAP